MLNEFGNNRNDPIEKLEKDKEIKEINKFIIKNQ